MSIKFFELSDYGLNCRRNLLLVGFLSYLHTKVEPLSELTIFNAKIPETLITFSLFALSIWFGATYFYYLYSEFTEWRLLHLNSDKSLSFYGKRQPTLVPYIEATGDQQYNLGLKFSKPVHENLFNRSLSENDMEPFHRQLRILGQDITKSIQQDIKRIQNFENAMSNYRLASKVKFYGFDLAIPIIATIASVALNL